MIWLIGLVARLPGVNKLSAGAQKAITYGLIVFLLLLAGRWVYNGIYDRGRSAGRVEMAEELIKQKKDEWQARETAIAEKAAAQEQEIKAKRDQVNAQLQEIARARGETRTALNKFIDSLDKEKAKQYENVYSIPAVELDAAIRDLSNQLATAE